MSSRALIAGTVAATLTITGLTFTGATGAGAATLPNSQSVGRFVDGAVGSSPIQQIANVFDARAVNPGTASDQNPLHVNALSAIDLPLTGSLQFPELLGIHLGAVNQVAVAKSDGFSYGASGAVDNSGGVSVGGNNAAFPANATIDLSAAALAGPVPVPGGGTADALGAVHVTIGALSALASTPAGVAKPGSTSYNIAGLGITAASPLLQQLVGTLGTTLGTLLTALNGLFSLQTNCPLLNGTLPDLHLDGGAITISASTGGISINLETLLQQLNLDLNTLAPNTDLIDLLLSYLSDPNGLADGLSTAITGLFADLKTQIDACAPSGLKAGADTLFTTLQTVLNGVGGLLGGLQLPGGGSALAPLGTLLKQLIDIGVNVQPNGPAGTFTSKLKATPSQITPVVAGQTIVRALELNLVGDPLATVALANAAAGPSNPATVTTTTVSPPGTAIPTGIPAGYAKPNGSPALPLVLLLMGLFLAGGGAFAWRLRGRHSA
ncbi:MAG: hypothetical protein QOG80_1908 [Pseudonocardiales bacterium]|nr:hypothetical protein [Pseudonocardiales bacterium]